MTTHTPFSFLPGQREILARTLATDRSCLVAADVGTGKTLMLLTLLRIRMGWQHVRTADQFTQTPPRHALIIGPGGTIRPGARAQSPAASTPASPAPSQWMSEIRRFCPGIPVYLLRTWADWAALTQGGDHQPPPGIYLTWYEAFLTSGASTPGAGHPSTGHTHHGIRCMPEPSLADRIAGAMAIARDICCGHAAQPQPQPQPNPRPTWDFVGLDESHRLAGATSHLTQSAIRVTATWRYAFTATPITDRVGDLFSTLGWLSHPHWHTGAHTTHQFPFRPDQHADFLDTFQGRQSAPSSATSGTNTRATAGRIGTTISHPARLHGILAPITAYITKSDCSPAYRTPATHHHRVPMAQRQAATYAHYQDLAHIRSASGNPLMRAALQTSHLRAICADPATHARRHAGTDYPHSQWTPKTLLALRLIRDALRQRHQSLIISARVAQSDFLADTLRQAGVPIARIDSATPAASHTAEAARLKSGAWTPAGSSATWCPVGLMGIKCAAGHSFSRVRVQILLSIEWTPGTVQQAAGRADRIDSPTPPDIHYLLHAGTIEDAQFRRVTAKHHAAQLAIRGIRYIPTNAATDAPRHRGGRPPTIHPETHHAIAGATLIREIRDAWRGWTTAAHSASRSATIRTQPKPETNTTP